MGLDSTLEQENLLDRGLKNLNNSTLRFISKAIAADATVDLLPVLQSLCETYPTKRQAIEDRPNRKDKRCKGQKLYGYFGSRTKA